MDRARDSVRIGEFKESLRLDEWIGDLLSAVDRLHKCECGASGDDQAELSSVVSDFVRVIGIWNA